MPAALTDYIVTLRDRPVEFDPVANDSDIVSISAMGIPANGLIGHLGGTRYVYTPNDGFVGTEQFSYTGRDASNVAYNATIIIRVRRPNVDTEIAPTSLDVEADGAVINLLAQITNPDGDTLQVTILEAPAHGTVSLTDDFEITYTPEAGYTGPDLVGYVVSDGDSEVRGEIALNVTSYTNTAPVASDFSQSVDFNTPTDFDVPAHQTDADGDPIQTQITAAPAHGTATVLPDQKIRYTPTLGYSGADEIKWKPFDGQDLGNEGTITITVNAAALPAFANGFLKRRRIVIPPRTANASTPAETNYVVLIRETLDGFKHLLHGGHIQHPSGWDFRVETEAGVQLDHKLESYDPATGAIILWFRIPSWAVHQQTRFLLYYGNQTIAADEQDVAGTYTGYLAVINARTGVDESGNGRTFTPSDTIASGTAIGDAASFFGDKIATAADPTWLNGHAGITVQAVINPAAGSIGTNKGWFTQGPTDQTDASAAFILQYLATSGSSTNLVHFKIRASDGTSYVLSGAGKHATGLQVVHASWTQGEAPKIYLGGALETPAAVGAARAGTTLAIAGEAAFIGRGQRDPDAGGWLGLVDEFRIKAGPITALRAAAEAANILAPATFYAIGDEDGPSDTTSTESPVALPFAGTVQSALVADFDVAATAYIPGGPAPTLASVGTVAHGDKSIVANKLRYQPFDLWVGDDGASYTLTRAGKSVASSLVIATLGPPAYRIPVTPPTTFPKLPPTAPANKQRWIGGGGPVGSISYTNTKAQVQQAFADAAPGDHIVFPNGTYAYDPGGTAAAPEAGIDIDKSGSDTDDWIVVRAANHLGATLGGFGTGGTRACGWRFTGTARIWITGFIGNNPQEHSPNHYKDSRNSYYNSDRAEYQFRLHGRNLRVTNCRINSPCGIAIGNSANRIDVCYNTFTMNTPVRWPQANGMYIGAFSYTSRGPSNITIARNKWSGDTTVNTTDDGDSDGRYCCYAGNNEPIDTNVGNNRTVKFIENFVEMVNTPVGWYHKRGYEIRDNFIRVKNVAFNLRHGGYSKSDGTAFGGLNDDVRALIIGNNFSQGIFRLNDTHHLVISNRMGGTSELYYGGRRCQGTSASSYTIETGTPPKEIPPGWTQAASYVIFVGNTFVGDLRAGEDEAAGGNKWKVWGAAERAAWDHKNDKYGIQHAQGDTIKGVKNYPAGVTGQPTDGNARFVRRINGLGETTILAGTAGYQVFPDSDNGGYGGYLQDYVVRADLETTTGCDAP